MLIVLPEMNIFWRENSKFCCGGFLLKTIMCLPTYLGIRYLLYIRNMKRKPLFCWFKKNVWPILEKNCCVRNLEFVSKCKNVFVINKNVTLANEIPKILPCRYNLLMYYSIR